MNINMQLKLFPVAIIICQDILTYVDGSNSDEKNLREWASGLLTALEESANMDDETLLRITAAGINIANETLVMLSKIFLWINQHVDGSNKGERLLLKTAHQYNKELEETGLFAGFELKSLESSVPPFPA